MSTSKSRKKEIAFPKVEELPSTVEPVSEPKPSDTVKVKVLIGTLSWEGGTFQKGETFMCTKEDLARFDNKDIKIVS